MSELIYRFDTKARHKAAVPKTPAAAVARLEDGNKQFARMLDHPEEKRVVQFDADELGIPTADGTPPTQTPFAAVLACADARVPVEMIFGQACNDLFVVRVAGNVLGAECLGSLDYAVSNMAKSLRTILVLGHTNCGAVGAAVDAFLEPTKYLTVASSHPLRAIVDRLFVSARSSHEALESVYGQNVEESPGYRRAMIHISVALNAALQAATLQSEFKSKLRKSTGVVFGVYDLATRRVGLTLEKDENLKIRLAAPPTSDSSFKTLGKLLASSETVRKLLET